jgi:hypothetical protein
MAAVLGIRLFARIISLLVDQRMTDTTSGFPAVGQRGIALSARTIRTTTRRSQNTILAQRLSLLETKLDEARDALRPSRG